MSGQRVPFEPGNNELASHAVGQPIAASHGGHWSQEELFLLARNTMPICAQTFRTHSLSPAATYVPYCRAPGIQCVAIAVEMAKASTAGRCTVAVTASSGSVTWVTDTALTGAHQIDCTDAALASYQRTIGILDVSALTAGTTIDLILTFTSVSGTLNGIYKIVVNEIPLASVSPQSAPTTEVGTDAGWTYPGRKLYDGTASTQDGFVRLMKELDQARTGPRRHICLVTPENTGTRGAWQVVSAVAAAIPFGTQGDPVIRFRVPLLSTGVPAPFTLRTRHKTSGANTGTIKILATPVGGGLATTTLALASSAGAFVATTGAITFDATGTDQEVDVSFQGTTTAGTLYLSQLSFISAQT